MKIYLSCIAFLCLIVPCISQSFYDQKSPQLIVSDLIKERGIEENLDSLITGKFKTIRNQLQTQKAESEISLLLQGEWVRTKYVRVNGLKEDNLFSDISFEFLSQNKFKTTEGKSTNGVGTYTIEKGQPKNLRLEFDGPQLSHIPEIYQKNMNDEHKSEIGYTTILLNIFEISEKEMLLYKVVQLNKSQDPYVNTYSRLLIEKFVKK